MSEPNFFIIGTTKGGTSTLHLWLNQHPDICLSHPKELHFYCRCPNPKLRAMSNRDDYLDRFPDCPVRGEASPCYLYDKVTAIALSHHYPMARLLVSLRDPVDRFWSHYLMNEIYRPSGLQPEEVLERNLQVGHTDALNDLLGMGMYGRQLREYLDVTSRDRIHVTFLESLASDPEGEIGGILDFLHVPKMPLETKSRDKQYVEPRGGVGRFFLRNRRVRQFGVAVLPPSTRRYLRTRILGSPSGKPQIPSALKKRLRTLYSDDCRILEDMLSRSLPWRWHREDEVSESA